MTAAAVAFAGALSVGLAFAASPAPSPTPTPDPRKLEIDLKTAEANLAKAEAEKAKAVADAGRENVELIKTRDARRQFNLEYFYRLLVLVAGFGVLVWMFPQVGEISIPWGTGSIVARKQLPPAPAPELPPTEPKTERGRMIRESAEARHVPVPWALVRRADEDAAYQAAGLERHSIYLVHGARKIPRSEYYRIRISLDAEKPEYLQKVDEVVYVLHPSFNPREIPNTDRRNNFAIDISAWGEFMVFAFVKLKGADEPVQLSRYLNF